MLLCGVIALTACGAESASSGSGARATTAPAAATTGGGASGGAASTVNVTGDDFKFMLDKSSVPAGTVTFAFKNAGPSPHNFVMLIDGKQMESKLINANETASLAIPLKAGKYKYICNVAGHEQLGMVGELTVT